MRVMITGASGFIGQHACGHLADVGCEVMPLSGTLKSHEWRDRLTSFQPTALLHCAGKSSVLAAMHEPAEDFRSGPVLTFEVLDNLRRWAPDCRFVLLSSAAVYGNPTLPVGEESPCLPISSYGYHKLQAELLCREFHHLYGLATCSVRIFSAYGPGLRRQVIWDVCSQALGTGRLYLQGTGQESRDFLFIRDVVAGLEAVLRFAPMKAEAYNLASGERTCIHDLAALILRRLGLKADALGFDGHVPPGIPVAWEADISKIQTLGFVPRFTLEEGLHLTLQWIRPLLAACGG